MKCPICGKDIIPKIELWSFKWVEVRTLCCEECLQGKKINKKVA